MVEFLKNPEKFSALGGKLPKGNAYPFINIYMTFPNAVHLGKIIFIGRGDIPLENSYLPSFSGVVSIQFVNIYNLLRSSQHFTFLQKFYLFLAKYCLLFLIYLLNEGPL